MTGDATGPLRTVQAPQHGRIPCAYRCGAIWALTIIAMSSLWIPVSLHAAPALLAAVCSVVIGLSASMLCAKILAREAIGLVALTFRTPDPITQRPGRPRVNPFLTDLSRIQVRQALLHIFWNEFQYAAEFDDDTAAALFGLLLRQLDKAGTNMLTIEDMMDARQALATGEFLAVPTEGTTMERSTRDIAAGTHRETRDDDVRTTDELLNEQD